MATINKDFKIKNGLVVEGSTATVNGNNILTETASDQYIIDLIGGETLVTSVNSTQLEVVNGELSVKANVFDEYGAADTAITNALGGGGAISDAISTAVNALDTDAIEEGSTNLYYTDSRVTNVITSDLAIVTGNIPTAIDNAINALDTDDIEEGGTNQYFTDSRARTAVVGLSPSSSTYLSDSGSGYIDINTNALDNRYDAAGAAQDVQDNLDDHTGASSNVHGVTGSVVGTTDSQDLSNKRFIDTVYFTDGTTIANEGEIAIRSGSHDFDVQANYGDLHLKTVYTDGTTGSDVQITSTYGDILLNANGAAYYGSASAENEIATHGYVDNAVSGLDWKQAVNLLAHTNYSLTGDASATSIDGHSLATANGYRVLLTGQSTDSEKGIYDVSVSAGSYTLTRSADADANDELKGAAVYVMEGSTYGATSWVQSNHYVGDTAAFEGQSWTQFSGQGSVTAGTGITVDGLEVSIDRTTVDDWYEADGAVSTHSGLTTGVHGVTGNVVGTSDTQTLSNKTLEGSTTFRDSTGTYVGAIGDSDGDLAIGGENNLVLYSSVEDIILNPASGRNAYVGSASSGNEIATTSDIPTSTDGLSEGSTNQYFTDTRAKMAVFGQDATLYDIFNSATTTNITASYIPTMGLTLTAENGVADSTTDDLDEGSSNQYFTDARAIAAARELLVNKSTLTNIDIQFEGMDRINITAENGVADSDTDDLTEGSTNLYFTDARAQSAVDGTTRSFTAININDYRKEEATQQYVASASTVTAHTFTGNRSVKYLVRTVGEVSGTLHSQITELLVTVDANNNVAVTEYGTIHTSENALATATVDYSGGEFRLRVTTLIAGAEVVAAATVMSWAD